MELDLFWIVDAGGDPIVERAGIRHHFVEHDRPQEPFRSVESSFRHLSRLQI